MPQSPVSAVKKTTETPDAPQHKSVKVANPALLLTITALDTTWRTFVPVIGGVALGVWFDNMWATKPVFTIIMLAIGVAIAAYLVYRQFKAVQL